MRYTDPRCGLARHRRIQEHDVKWSISRGSGIPRNVRLLGWASCLNDVASEMIYPLLPMFLTSVLHGSRFYLGVIEGLGESVACLLKLWAGARSDRVGQRKAFVVSGYAVSAVARPRSAVATIPAHLFGLRIIDRIGKGTRTAPRDAMIADSTLPALRGLAFGFHRAMDHLGAAAGPLLAAALLAMWPDRLRLVFGLTLVPGVLVVVLLVWGLRETTAGQSTTTPIPRTLRPPDARFRRLLLAVLVFALGNSSDAFLLLRAGDLGISTAQLPLLWFGFHVAKSAGNLLVGRLVDRVGPQPLLVAGWLVYAAVYFGFAIATSAWQMVALFGSYALYYALAEPSEKTLVAALAGPTQRGQAFGWYHLALGAGALPASVVFGAIYDAWGPTRAFGVGAILAGVAIGLLCTVQLSSGASDPCAEPDRDVP